MNSVAVLERILDKASALTHHCAVNTMLHGCCVLESSRHESNVVLLGHLSIHAPLIQSHYAAMPVSYGFHKKIILTQHFVNTELCVAAGNVVKGLAPHPIHGETATQDAVGVEGEKRPFLLHVVQCLQNRKQ